MSDKAAYCRTSDVLPVSVTPRGKQPSMASGEIRAIGALCDGAPMPVSSVGFDDRPLPEAHVLSRRAKSLIAD
jgi:hypothetical protein